MKFEETTSGIIEPCDILSIPEDKLFGTIRGCNDEHDRKFIEDLRKQAEFKRNTI